jgi:hypothetical protein
LTNHEYLDVLASAGNEQNAGYRQDSSGAEAPPYSNEPPPPYDSLPPVYQETCQ